MKITTANIKSPAYQENHELFVGTHTGSFKKIQVNDENPHKQINLQNISVLNKHSRITTLAWGVNTSEILIGRANKFVKVFDVTSNDATSCIEMIDGPIVGLTRYNGYIVAGIANGKIQIFNESPTILHTGDHLSTMRSCPVDPKLVATGGKDRQNNLKVWNLEIGKSIFTSKNLKNDYLQLEVPIWDNGLVFLDDNSIGTCSRYGYIRLYDMRKQRRPILTFTNPKEQISYSCITAHENIFYVGTTTGILRAFDNRKLKCVLHTYKGFTGSVSDIGIDETGKYLYTASLDRFVRVHCSQSTALLYQCYVKSKATNILLRNTPEDLNKSSADDCVILPEECESDDEVEEAVEDKNDDRCSDLEYDEMFDNMPTVGDEEYDNDRKRSNVTNTVDSIEIKRKKLADYNREDDDQSIEFLIFFLCI